MNQYGIKGKPDLPMTLEKNPRSYGYDSHLTLMLEGKGSRLVQSYAASPEVE